MDSSVGPTDYESVEPEVLPTSKPKSLKGFLCTVPLNFPEAELPPNILRASVGLLGLLSWVG